jgi:hypothetical protein
MDQRISLITLGVADLDKAAAFQAAPPDRRPSRNQDGRPARGWTPVVIAER